MTWAERYRRIFRARKAEGTESMQRTFALYRANRHLIEDGDLLLFRAGRLPSLSGLIAAFGRGDHSHAAKVGKWGDSLMVLEVREFRGGRITLLSNQVQKFPGRIDVYRPNPENRWAGYLKTESVAMMRQLVGCEYGYSNILRVGFLHLAFVRLFVRADLDDRAISRAPPFCSSAVAMAERIGGGVDPVPHLADRLTEPADLARSQFYSYLFTLIP